VHYFFSYDKNLYGGLPCPSLGSVIGIEFDRKNRKNFVEVKISWNPFMDYYPLPSISYGVSF